MKIEDIAKVCHEANRAFCVGLGDNSQTTWETAPQWQIDSAINGVKAIIADPNAPASASHDSWYAEKEANGWKYGPVKNADLKEHPCMVPYNELPLDQQAKDYLFNAVVISLMPLL